MIKPTKEEIFSKVNKDIEWIKNHIIFLTVAGSHSYGLNGPSSDIDLRGVTTVPKQYLYGFQKNFDHLVASDPFDIQVFNIIKFFALTSQCNPNTLEILFTDEEDHVFVSDIGRVLLDNRDKFLSRNLKERYIGYSKAQMHRMKLHKSWIDCKMQPPPTREEFGLPKKIEIPYDQLLTVQAIYSKKIEEWNCDFEPFSEPQKIYLQGKVSKILAEMDILSDNKWELAARNFGANENFILLLQKEKAYENIVKDYENYLSWKRNRNPVRAALEEKVGFDCKFAVNLIRLLIQGKEVLETGKLNVKRKEDREMLLEIRNGHWEYERVLELADKIENEVKEAYFKSPLPINPNIKELDNLCIQLIEMSLNKG